MATCPICKERIDDDSYFCEHCGTELYICPACFPQTRTFGKGAGKRCGQCGGPLVPAKTQEDGVPVSPHVAAQTAVPPVQTAVPPVQTSAPPAQSRPTSLFCAAQQTRLILKDGGTIGREQGDYIRELYSFIYVSSIHARLNWNGQQWIITDLGSRNGTKVNGMPCTPALPFNTGDIVRLGNFYDFKVE